MKTFNERTADVSARIKTHKRKKHIVTASCVSLAAVVLALVLFVPYSSTPPDVSAYADSPYYAVIQRINEASYTKPRYRNNFEALLDGSVKIVNEGLGGKPSISEDIFNASGNAELGVEGSGKYVEVTDNQVEGIVESDIIKRSTEYIYYLRNCELFVYSIAGGESALAGHYDVGTNFSQNEIDEWGVPGYYDNVEMYLSADCAIVTLVMDSYFKTTGSCTLLVSLDVTDPGNITETNRVYVTGSYLSSRMVDGKLLLMSKFRVYNNKDFSDESTFLPQVGVPGSMVSVAAEDIVAPETLSSVYYTVACAIDGSTLQVNDTAAFLSYSDDIYVSNDHVFASRSYSETGLLGARTTLTEISCLNYSGDALEYLGSVTVEGSIKDQYSMDEYEGILRVVTSVSNTLAFENDDRTVSAGWERNASLFCISLEDFSIVASVEKFAPDNEQAESVRFDGDYAYVCTAEVITLTDPVYFFDLSDLDNITWTDTGTIDGYSTSLIQLGEGFLLGIGYGDSWNLKVEVYEEYKGSVISVCAYEADASFSEDYKSYLIDRENDLIGLAIADWGCGINYILLHFDGYELHERIRIPLDGGELSTTRAFIADGWLYVLTGFGLTVEKVW